MKVCTSTAEAEEDKIKSFYASAGEEIDYTPKQDVLIITDGGNTTVGNQIEPNFTWAFGARNEAQEELV